MSVDQETVRGIARLARVEVPEDDLGPLSEELSKILLWVEQLGEVDTAGVPPVASVTETRLRHRADEVADGGIAEKVTANAPDRQQGMFAVPKVVE